MKNSFFLKAFSVIAVLSSIVSCKPEDAPVQKNLPTIADMEIAPGSEMSVEFYAYEAWSVSADKKWLNFSEKGGAAGDNELTMKVADAFAESETAAVILSIGEDKVSFKVTRTAKARTFTVKVDGAVVSVLEFSEEKKSYEIKVEANFMWDLDRNSTAWPGWLAKPESAVSGVLNSTSGLYESSFTLSVDETAISNYYDSKTGVVSFSDLNDLNYVTDLAVSHTFEKPAQSLSVLSSQYGTTLTLTKDARFKESGTDSIDFTLTPDEGESEFQAFVAVQLFFETDLWQDGTEILQENEMIAIVAGNYVPGQWVTFTQKEGDVWTLQVKSYPEPFTQGSLKTTTCARIYMLPKSVYGGFIHPTPNDHKWMMNKGDIMDGVEPLESMKKYVLTVNVEK